MSLGTILAGILGAVGIGLAARHLLGRRHARAKLRRKAARAASSLGGVLEGANLIGAGNAGAVFQASLRGDWERELGMQWVADGAMPEYVAVKFASFPHPEKRAALLAEIAGKIMARRAAQPGFPLCPFLGIGMVEHGGERWVVEIMPMLAGESLERRMERGPLAADSLNRLLECLETVTFLEGIGMLTRNLDVENIIVAPDGRWIRIDIDNARREERMPLARMGRLGLLARQVIEGMDGLSAVQEECRGIVAQIRRTERRAKDPKRKEAEDRAEPILNSTEDLCRVLRQLESSRVLGASSRAVDIVPASGIQREAGR